MSQEGTYYSIVICHCQESFLHCDISHRGLKLDRAIGQGEIRNSLKSENF